VKLQIVAELGRRRMKVRDLVALAPGSVIELDRAAGSPVDVMVNGALLAHGEVVVIDEEFGSRLSEIVMEDGA
jgi:flagellar motor switch protein FliN/FliY